MNNIIEILGKERLDKIKYDVDIDSSIVFTAIDSIFSIQANYKTVVEPLVFRFKEFIKTKGFTENNFTPKDFVEMFKNWDFDKLAIEIFKNKQRTSANNGILKAEAVFLEIDMLNKNNIQSKKDLLNSTDLKKIEKEWRGIKGQNSGITWRYFLMGCGFTSYFKDDTWIYRFFINKLGYKDIQMNNDYNKLKTYFEKEYIQVKKDYPKMTITKLDNEIWEYMVSKK